MTVLFDGIALGMLLFLISVGLSVTLGLMNFVNLAHGSFAMLGGYLAVVLINKIGVPFFLALPLVVVASALVGAILERLLYRRLYTASHMDHVLFSVGLIFISISTAVYFFGSSVQAIDLPELLKGRLDIGFAELNIYRIFLIFIALLIVFGLQLLVTKSRFGAQLRASVDNPRTARGIGIEVDTIFTVTFALGSGLAGLGGALGIELLGMDPVFAIKYIVYFLIVVIVGGPGSIKGSAIAAVVIGVADVVGKYYVPELGAFVIYALMIVILLARSKGFMPNLGGRS